MAGPGVTLIQGDAAALAGTENACFAVPAASLAPDDGPGRPARGGTSGR